MILPGAPATTGDLLLVAGFAAFVSLIFACHLFHYSSIVAFLTMCAVAAYQVQAAYLYGPYNTSEHPGWDFQMDVLQWWFFVPMVLCNLAATLSSVPAAGALVKRMCDPSLQPWSEETLAEWTEEATRRGDVPIPSLTVLLPCYMPNEQDIVEETIEHLLTKLRYPRSFTLVVCYNTPHPLPIEERLAAMEGQRWQGACDGLNTLRVLNVRDSTSKAHNLNAALAEVSTDHVVIYDADHHPDPPSLEILTSYMLAHRCACVQGSTYLRRQDSALALLINAEFFITHFVIFPAQQVFINTGFFGGSNALWSAAVLKQRHFRHDVQTEDIEYSARALLGNIKIRFCPEARSGELPPASVHALWKQRLRWAVGWEQVTLQHVRAIARSRMLHPCRKASLFWILPMRWLLLVLSLFSVFAVPALAVANISVLLPPSPWPWASPSFLSQPFLALQTRQLVQYQWTCFVTLFVVVLLTACLYEWRKPHRIVFVVLFFLLGPAYLLITLALTVASIGKICRGKDAGWVVTSRSNGDTSQTRLSGAFGPDFATRLPRWNSYAKIEPSSDRATELH